MVSVSATDDGNACAGAAGSEPSEDAEASYPHSGGGSGPHRLPRRLSCGRGRASPPGTSCRSPCAFRDGLRSPPRTEVAGDLAVGSMWRNLNDRLESDMTSFLRCILAFGPLCSSQRMRTLSTPAGCTFRWPAPRVDPPPRWRCTTRRWPRRARSPWAPLRSTLPSVHRQQTDRQVQGGDLAQPRHRRQRTRPSRLRKPDPAAEDRIPRDSRGPRVGALGHSAGAYTVLALAGAVPDLSRIRKHCQAEAAADPIFCSMGRPEGTMMPLPAATSSLKDERVRAVVATAPAGVVLTAESLATV